MLGDGCTEPRQIPGRRGRIGLSLLQRRVGLGERRQPPDQEVQLNVGGFLTPQGAVVVEHADSIFGGHEVRSLARDTPDEVFDRPLRGSCHELSI
jgi:hypothetical protein